ncbi:MAG: site-specific integrase [Xanthobacteraceae bacterium]|nr:site-specific integrase [Xanthobacteraceae bacterium]
MLGRQAKIITPAMLQAMLDHVAGGRHAARDRVIILLSVKAGLRACEIAGLDWSMVLGPNGKVGATLDVRTAIAKGKSGRRLPMHPELGRALRRLLREADGSGPVVRSARGGAMRANSIVNWFVALYAALGFEGCSSHSGRRSFITSAARNVAKVDCSLRDVQVLAGHRSIETTQLYIDGDSNAQRRLMALI